MCLSRRRLATLDIGDVIKQTNISAEARRKVRERVLWTEIKSLFSRGFMHE